MARIIPCDTHPTAPAALLVTQQATGDVAAVCLTCLPEWAAFLLMTSSGDRDPGDVLADVIGEVMAAAEPVTLDGEPVGEPVPAPDPTTGDDTDEDAAADGVNDSPTLDDAMAEMLADVDGPIPVVPVVTP